MPIKSLWIKIVNVNTVKTRHVTQWLRTNTNMHHFTEQTYRTSSCKHTVLPPRCSRCSELCQCECVRTHQSLLPHRQDGGVGLQVNSGAALHRLQTLHRDVRRVPKPEADQIQHVAGLCLRSGSGSPLQVGVSAPGRGLRSGSVSPLRVGVSAPGRGLRSGSGSLCCWTSVGLKFTDRTSSIC